MAQATEFPSEVLPNRRIKIMIGAISLVFAGDAKKVEVERRERNTRRGTTWVDDSDYHAAANQAKKYFRSLRPAALKESQAAKRAETRARQMKETVSPSAEKARPRRPASHPVVHQQLRLSYAAA